MNSLEFIEKEIEDRKENVKHWEKQLERYPNDEVFTRGLNKSKEQLETLQQIKSALEAWEVVKHTIYKRKMGEESFIQVMGGVYNEGQCWTSGINPYEIIKKALEVEE